MTEAELKRLFKRIIVAAIPVPALIGSACISEPIDCHHGRCIQVPTTDASTGGNGGLVNNGGSGGDPCAANSTGGAAGCAAYCLTATTEMSAGGIAQQACVTYCAANVTSCELVTSNGQQELRCHPACARPPASDPDLVASGNGDALVKYFEEMAQLEAASIPAFRNLRRELVTWSAPVELVREARRAVRDEIRHARLAGTLARKFGGQYRPPASSKPDANTLENLATENAVCGCVGETFGALIATWQAETATDPDVRRALREIADDEVRHAALAWRIARWAEGRLDPEARTRVASKRRAAAQVLLGRQSYRSSPELESIAGVPHSARARGMATQMLQSLWT